MELERGISHTQASIARAQKRQQQLQGQNINLKQRISDSIAAIDTLQSVSTLLPDASAVPDPDQGTCPPILHVLLLLYMPVCLRSLVASRVSSCCPRKDDVPAPCWRLLQAPTSLAFRPQLASRTAANQIVKLLRRPFNHPLPVPPRHAPPRRRPSWPPTGPQAASSSPQ